MMAQRHFLGPPQSMLLPECILASRSQRGLNGPGIYLETDRLPAFCFSETVFWDLGRHSDLQDSKSRGNGLVSLARSPLLRIKDGRRDCLSSKREKRCWVSL